METRKIHCIEILPFLALQEPHHYCELSKNYNIIGLGEKKIKLIRCLLLILKTCSVTKASSKANKHFLCYENNTEEKTWIHDETEKNVKNSRQRKTKKKSKIGLDREYFDIKNIGWKEGAKRKPFSFAVSDSILQDTKLIVKRLEGIHKLFVNNRNTLEYRYSIFDIVLEKTSEFNSEYSTHHKKVFKVNLVPIQWFIENPDEGTIKMCNFYWICLDKNNLHIHGDYGERTKSVSILYPYTDNYVKKINKIYKNKITTQVLKDICIKSGFYFNYDKFSQEDDRNINIFSSERTTICTKYTEFITTNKNYEFSKIKRFSARKIQI